MSPCFGARIERLLDVSRKRNAGMLRRNRKPVDFGERAQRHLAANEEVSEQARIGRAGRGHVHKEAVERLRLFRRRKQINVIALLDRVRFERD